MIIQTEWTKPYNQCSYVCQFTNIKDFAVSAAVSFRELYENKEEVKELKKKQIKASLMHLVELEIDRTLKNMNWPDTKYIDEQIRNLSD